MDAFPRAISSEPGLGKEEVGGSKPVGGCGGLALLAQTFKSRAVSVAEKY